MSEQRFDIIVQDKVAKSIRTELTGIGAAARGTRGFIAELKAELAGMATAQGGMNGATTAATRSFREEAAAANAARTALAEQRKEAEALARALRDQAQAAKQAASASAGARGGGVPSNGGGGQPGPQTPPSPAPAGPSRTTSANLANAARNIRAVGEEAKLSTQYAAQLGFQLNDVVVSAASGQKLLTVAIQQGAQIAQIPSQAGLSWKQFGSQALNTLGVIKRTGDAALDAAAAQAATAAAAVAAANAQAASNVRVAETEVALATAETQVAQTSTAQAAAAERLTAANEALAASNADVAITAKALSGAQEQAATASTAADAASVRSLSGLAKGGIAAGVVLAALGVTVAALNHEASNDGLKKYSKDMGYTAAEVKKLNDVTVTYGDTAKAVFQVGIERIASAFGLNTKGMAKVWRETMDQLAQDARATIAAVYAGFTGTFYALDIAWKNFKKGTFQNPLTELTQGYKDAYASAQGFMDDVVKRSQKNARDRQDKMAADMFDAKKPKKAPKEWDRAQELKNTNAELDAQIGLLDKYGDELERANQLEQISKKFRDHNVPLTAAETAALEAKIRTIQEGRRVQEAMTAADEAANGAERKYGATLDALNLLRERGRITQEQYTEQLRMATRAYEDATDPLAALNRELQHNGELMGLYGKDKDVASYIQQLQAAAEAQGKSIYQEPPKDANGDEIVVNGRGRKLTDQAQGMVDEYERQQKQGDFGQAFEAIDPKSKEDPGSSSYILDHQKELYEELKRLREQDVISEAEAARRKQNLDRAYLDARLENTSTMLGQLSQLQNSKNKELAALGKAAAIAQATIDGYRAVQAALVGPPGPPWSFAIAGVTGAMAAANVAKIAGIGFMSGGYTGNGAPTDVAGQVHGQEYVFDAAATRRIGIPALDAMRRGTQLAAPANNNRPGPTVVVKPMPGVFVEQQRTPEGDIEMIARRVVAEDAPKTVARDLRSGANGHMGRAIGNSYGLKRSDR